VAAQVASDPVNAYPTAPPVYPGFTRKPTDVMGRRIGAYLLNGLFAAIIIGGLTLLVLFIAKPGTRYNNVFDQTGHTAQYYCDNYDTDHPNNNKICIANGDHVTLIGIGPVIGSVLGFSVAFFFLNNVLLEGLTGASVGKHIVGLRVVRRDGSKPGIGWAALRTLLLWIPDGILGGIVGLIVASINGDHQRVGDMAAGTYVVDKHAAGQPPVALPMPYAAYPPPVATTPGPQWGAQPAPPAQGSFGPAPAPTQAPAAAPVAAQPQWDQARNTYIWWNADEQRWLEHDQASGEWRPISQ
jgi:uncharacterized RDD family membrane protein YckC